MAGVNERVKAMTMVKHWNSEEEMLCDMRAEGFHPFHYTYPPGTVFRPHTHDHDKIAAVIEGTFRIIMGGEEVILKTGDGVFVPEGALHSAEVIGNEPVISVDAPRR
ncbi:MAG: cupin domain-containing protein [Magnetococcales bacterium]|nr:cupin domain-containing protein [Magnetococcales bacterium]